MTYRELLGYAQKKIDNNEITVREYMEMTKVLNREIDVLDKIKTEILLTDKTVKNVRTDGHCFFTADEIIGIIDKYKGECK